MTVYETLLKVISEAALEARYAQLGVPSVLYVVNDVHMLLNSDGRVYFAGKFYGGPFARRKGRELYRRVRWESGVSDKQENRELAELRRLGYREANPDEY